MPKNVKKMFKSFPRSPAILTESLIVPGTYPFQIIHRKRCAQACPLMNIPSIVSNIVPDTADKFNR